MGLSTGTLNGVRLTDARVYLPEWGVWYAEVSTDGEQSFNGPVTLVLADLTLKGTVLEGGPVLGRSSFYIAGGAGGWGKPVTAWSYTNDLGVRLSTVLGDVAGLVGETVEGETDERVGPAWARQAGPACTTLNLVAPKRWYVGEDGKTRLGARPATKYAGNATRVQKADVARGKVVLAADTIASLLPGVTVDGITAADVMHELSADGLRTTIYGGHLSTSDAMHELLEELDPDRNYRGSTEYRVVFQEGDLLELEPVRRASSGMPDLKRVPVFPGAAGLKVFPPLGSRCVVQFLDSDPSRPYVSGFESSSAAVGLTAVTDGVGAGGHAVTLEQVLGLFAQYTAARAAAGDLGLGFTSTYAAAPPAALATLLLAMVNGAVAPTPIGPAPGGVLDALGLPALIAAALAAQLPDPASAGLPTPVMPGLAKKDFRL